MYRRGPWPSDKARCHSIAHLSPDQIRCPQPSFRGDRCYWHAKVAADLAAITPGKPYLAVIV